MSVRSHHEIAALVEAKPRTRSLDVANGGLSSLPDELDQLKLHKLHIFANEFSEVPSQIRNQPGLRELSIESNAVAELPTWLGELEHLTTLQVGRNQLSRLVLDGPESLEVLNAPWNPIGELRLQNLPRLRRLDLARSTLEELPSMAGHPELRELHCTMSPLRELPDLLGCPLLEKLTVNGNQLIRLPAEVAALPHLNQLHLSSNRVTDWPQFGGALTSLFIAQNQLSELPSAVLTATGLRVLNVSGNPLTDVPDELATLPLRFLDLSGTKIDVFPACIAKMDGLEHLLLNNTAIENWPPFDPPPRLKRFSAYGAPFMELSPPEAWRRHAS